MLMDGRGREKLPVMTPLEWTASDLTADFYGHPEAEELVYGTLEAWFDDHAGQECAAYKRATISENAIQSSADNLAAWLFEMDEWAEYDDPHGLEGNAPSDAVRDKLREAVALYAAEFKVWHCEPVAIIRPEA